MYRLFHFYCSFHGTNSNTPNYTTIPGKIGSPVEKDYMYYEVKCWVLQGETNRAVCDLAGT